MDISPTNTSKHNSIRGKQIILLRVPKRETGKNSQKISNIKPFISKYNWKRTNYSFGIAN